MIDDFAVEDDTAWSADGRRLVIDAWSLRPAGTSTVRIVTAGADTPKVSMLVALGLESVEQWWVKPVPDPQPTASVEPRPIGTDSWSGILASAPPVYDPGGPVLLIRQASPAVDLGSIEQTARPAGAVIVVFPIPTGDVTEQHARDRKWSVASQWYSGVPVDD